MTKKDDRNDIRKKPACNCKVVSRKSWTVGAQELPSAWLAVIHAAEEIPEPSGRGTTYRCRECSTHFNIEYIDRGYYYEKTSGVLTVWRGRDPRK